MPEVQADEHLVIGENWDWVPNAAGLLLKITRADGLQILCFTEAGIVGGKIGLNSKGLGLVINGLLSDRDNWARLKKPFHVRCFEILNSTDLRRALQIVTETERSCSANFLIAQATGLALGEAIDLEAAPHAVCHFEPQDGLLAHANHFSAPD